MSKKVRMGVIGLGGMGIYHANYIKNGQIDRCELSAVFDIDKSKFELFPDVKCFTSSEELIRSGEVDAVLIATPHYFHTPIGIDALENGLHVLVEKPISVHKADCERLIAAHKDEKQIFAAMFNLRTSPIYVKLKKMIDDGELGEITRISWIITNWFRTDAYYASADWRGTWSGEGGGVLLNQCPHQFDFVQWLFGMPTKIRAFCGFGTHHNIEVEDEATVYLEFANGSNGTIITSTGETPGTNRLEIAAEMGKVVMEDSKLTFIRNEVPMTEYSKNTTDVFSKPDVWNIEIPVSNELGKHENITQNFVDAILDGTPLIAPAKDGMKSVELANAMLYSSLTDSTIELPLDGKAFEAKLNELIENSKFKKVTKKTNAGNFSNSFNK